MSNSTTKLAKSAKVQRSDNIAPNSKWQIRQFNSAFESLVGNLELSSESPLPVYLKLIMMRFWLVPVYFDVKHKTADFRMSLENGQTVMAQRNKKGQWSTAHVTIESANDSATKILTKESQYLLCLRFTKLNGGFCIGYTFKSLLYLFKFEDRMALREVNPGIGFTFNPRQNPRQMKCANDPEQVVNLPNRIRSGDRLLLFVDNGTRTLRVYHQDNNNAITPCFEWNIGEIGIDDIVLGISIFRDKDSVKIDGMWIKDDVVSTE